MTNSSSAQKRKQALTTLRDSSPFGNKLIQAGYADVTEIEKARQEVSASEGKRSFPEALSAITGKELPPELYRQYKKHHLFELKIFYGVDSLDPETENIDDYPIEDLIDEVIPVDICRRYKVLPLAKREESRPPTLLVGMVNPDQLDAQDNLTRILRPKKLKLQRVVLTLEDYERIIGQYLDNRAQQEDIIEQEKQLDVTQDIHTLESEMDGLEEVKEDEGLNLEDSLKCSWRSDY